MAVPALSLPDTGPRTRFSCGVVGGLPWELWRRLPLPEAAGSIVEIWAGRGAHAGERHRTLPNGEVALMFHLGAAQRLTECDGAAADALIGAGFVAGLQERPTTFESLEPATRVVAARLTPLGAWRVLGGLGQAAIARRVFDVEEVFDRGAGVRELRARMVDRANLGEALDVFEDWLALRLRVAPAHHPALGYAMELLSRGTDRTRDLASACDVSARRLREVFGDEIGIPAKRLARILRFRRALERLAKSPGLDLAALAVDCGYYDQPHLYREFRELAGLTPRAYLRALGAGLDGPDVVSG